MFLQLSTFLTIFQLIFAAGSPNVFYSTDDGVKAANIYDETALQNIQERLDQQQTINENLRLKIESLEMKFNQGIKNDLGEIKAAITTQKESLYSGKAYDQEYCKNFCENLTDIRGQSIYQFKNVTKQPTIMQLFPTSCAQALEKSGSNGIYKIKVPFSELEPFYAYCVKDIHDADASKNTSGWLVIQRRQDGSVDFFRNWVDYRNFFGNLEGEFFIGLENIRALTQSTIHELWIQMEDYEGNKRWAKYSSFAIGGESDDYTLNILGAYTGDAGDSLSYHAGMKWSTPDRENDKNPNENCAQKFKGAWWYNTCHESNLNGLYKQTGHATGINWYNWHGHTYSLKYVHMAIRPVR